MTCSGGVHHLEKPADACAEIAGRPAKVLPARVAQLWAYGDLLDNDILTRKDDLTCGR
jgi:hypothetical protein